MQEITLTLRPSPSLPVEILDQAIQRAEREGMTPEEWVYAQIQNALKQPQAEGVRSDAAVAA